MSQTLGFIGVGVMGEPMCRHLATKSGTRVLACDRDPEPLRRLEQAGVQSAGIADIARDADIIFLSLPSGEVVEQVVLGAQGLLSKLRSGQTLVDLSTSPHETAIRLSAALKDAGVHFADAPVMRTRAAAQAGTLAVPVGADQRTFALLEPLIKCFATDVMHAGPVGCGQVVKILNNMVVYETVLALAEARAVAVRVGMDPEQLFNAFATGSADSFALRNQGFKAILPQQFPEKAFPVTYARKDLSYAVRLAEQVGVNATGAKNLIASFNQAIEAGYGDMYAPAISLLFEGATGKGDQR
ncbi:NAD(P)-dependent oxidoreductase [Bordetella sp. BOR01]|uniref:NAD(P)-dependent oxidoreductase n=1 Tax=Bordetella sp. BOR01 TaxID=2854779 RepID=UPI001C46482B|nr:NAD(P)-dependent oxidoreductase [Bordetella sp. BOR01]MBV7482152.1 NAD(P)-dependent oxidoreductase [Bordetella sp. BOR01]